MSNRIKFLNARWEHLIMANYVVAPDVLQPYLPAGLELDLYHGDCYVSLVGFMFKNTKIFGVPIPVMSSFEEVNLRFYVTRRVGNEVKRGVVFLNEVVPYAIVAWMANNLYYEHYKRLPTSHKWHINEAGRNVHYGWKDGNKWNSITVQAGNKTNEITDGSLEEFIFEHYYGYSRISPSETLEYRVDHPRWAVHEVKDYTVDCSFDTMYGNDFSHLSSQQPASVFLAAGSPVSVDWQKERFSS